MLKEQSKGSAEATEGSAELIKVTEGSAETTEDKGEDQSAKILLVQLKDKIIFGAQFL